MKILIIRFSSIGDIVLTSPVVRCIKKQIPNAEIHFLTKHSYKEIIEHNPHIDVCHYLKNDLGEIIPILKKEKFDFVADLHNNIRSAQVRWSLLRRSNVLNKINLEKWLYVNFKWNIMPIAHIVDRYVETVRNIGIRPDGEGLDYFIAPGDEVYPEDLPLSHLHGFVALVIGAKHNTKKLPQEKLRNLVRLLPYPIILLGGTEDREAGETIKSEDEIKIFNGCGKYSLNQSASVIRQSKLVITHDTGLMHIAAAYKKKIISLWGNTVPAFGMTPYYGERESPASKIFEIENLRCRPCSKIGFEKCPKKHFKCMQLIDETAIAKMAGTL